MKPANACKATTRNEKTDGVVAAAFLFATVAAAPKRSEQGVTTGDSWLCQFYIFWHFSHCVHIFMIKHVKGVE